MVLYWIRNITSNNPTVLKYIGHHTSVNEAARNVFNGRHYPHFNKSEKKHDPKNDVLLFGNEDVLLKGFHHDELQEELED